MKKVYALSLTNNPECIYTELYNSFEEAKDVAFKLMKASQSKYPSKAIDQLVSDHKIKGNSPYYEDYIIGENDDNGFLPIKSLYIIEGEYSKIPNDLGGYIVDHLKDWAWENGGDYGEDYLDNISDTDLQQLNNYLEHWFEKQYAPNWFDSCVYKKVGLNKEEK